MAATSTHRKPSLRRRLWLDDSVQAMLMVRTAVYTATFVLYFCVVIFCTQWMSDAQTPMHQHLWIFALDAMYWAPGLLFIGPLVAHDLLRLTTRFSGPVHRLGAEMGTLARGGTGHAVTLRPDDYWKEMAESYNQLREEVVRLRAGGQHAAPSDQDDPSPAASARRAIEAVEMAGSR